MNVAPPGQTRLVIVGTTGMVGNTPCATRSNTPLSDL
jgi:hypothetical protein